MSNCECATPAWGFRHTKFLGSLIAFTACKTRAAGHMKEAGYGRIINVTSQAGLRGNFGQTNYGAAKAAIMGMTFIWSLELGR